MIGSKDLSGQNFRRRHSSLRRFSQLPDISDHRFRTKLRMKLNTPCRIANAKCVMRFKGVTRQKHSSLGKAENALSMYGLSQELVGHAAKQGVLSATTGQFDRDGTQLNAPRMKSDIST